MGPRLAVAGAALKTSIEAGFEEGGASKVVSYEREATDEAGGYGPVRIGGASERVALGQAHPVRTRQGRMVMVAQMMRGAAHDAGL